MVPGEALGGHLWPKGWPKGTILATMGGQSCHFGAPWWPKVTILVTMGGQSGHFGAPWWPKVTILATMGGQSGQFGAHWWPKVAKRVKKEKPGTFSGNNNVVTGEKNRRDKARKVWL